MRGPPYCNYLRGNKTRLARHTVPPPARPAKPRANPLERTYVEPSSTPPFRPSAHNSSHRSLQSWARHRSRLGGAGWRLTVLQLLGSRSYRTVWQRSPPPSPLARMVLVYLPGRLPARPAPDRTGSPETRRCSESRTPPRGRDIDHFDEEGRSRLPRRRAGRMGEDTAPAVSSRKTRSYEPMAIASATGGAY
jgi:hypothetical protein